MILSRADKVLRDFRAKVLESNSIQTPEANAYRAQVEQLPNSFLDLSNQLAQKLLQEEKNISTTTGH